MRTLPILTRCLCLAWLLSTGLYSCKSAKSGKYSHAHSTSRTGTSAKSSRASTKEAWAKAETVIEKARTYLGTPYKYGGTTRQGMDCSGLLFTSFKAADLSIPRTSQEQAQMGKPVKVADVQPGDLLFFSDKKGSGKVSHVGMVTEVPASDRIMFIHSTTRRGVMEDNLFTEYYYKIFVKAIRPF